MSNTTRYDTDNVGSSVTLTSQMQRSSLQARKDFHEVCQEAKLRASSQQAKPASL